MILSLDKEFLYKEYVENKKSIRNISDETKIAQMSIYDAIIGFDIPIRKSKKFQIPRDILYVEYIENNKTMEEISSIFGCSFSVIQSLIKKYKIESRVGKADKLSILPEELLRKLYIDDDLRIRQIADQLNISERYVSDTLKRFNIPRKRTEKISHKIDIAGQKFGRLAVISLYEDSSIDGYVWLCKCDCGNETKVGAHNLLDPNRAIKSCGCARAKNFDWKIIPPYHWGGIVSKAIHRGIFLNISKEYVENLFFNQNGQCALSGVELCFGRSRDKKETTASLDRINSDIGYVEGNVQWVHKKLQISKHVTPNSEFINWCKLVAEFHK